MTATPTLARAEVAASGAAAGAPVDERRRPRRAGSDSARCSPRCSRSSAGRSGSRSLSDNSFFWHLRTGEYILDHGIPHHDVFSFTAPGTKWVAQSWLAEVTYGALVPGGRRVRHPVLRRRSSARASACSRTASRCGWSATGSCACGITLAALAGIYTLWSERPLLIGVLFFLVLLWVVEVPDSLVGRHPMIVAAGAVLAVGERARHVRARLRVPRAAPARPLGRRRAARGTGRERLLLVGGGDRRSRWRSSTRTASSS